MQDLPEDDDVQDQVSSPTQPEPESEPDHPQSTKLSEGDYIHVGAYPFMMDVLRKQGDQAVLFADKILKVTGSGKMKSRVLIATDFAIYIFDMETNSLKRRVALAAVDKICMSELIDHFFVVVVPTEYDLLLVSTRKNQIITAFVEATIKASDYELEIVSSNRFEYNAAADLVKELEFEEVEGGVKTRISRK
ncbi:hypothetical protein PIB30_005840 [Stylosanthes scabra]|uniref:TH1 domain-containing protein n=1 Tax=Stylosanthes scabra TaxID=79078 RepID=A0ABU6Z0U6_9FABA|nr:hypothetical protein [Stylosanthes scabra]